MECAVLNLSFVYFARCENAIFGKIYVYHLRQFILISVRFYVYQFQFRNFILIALRFLFNAFISEFIYSYDCVVADCGALSVSVCMLVIACLHCLMCY